MVKGRLEYVPSTTLVSSATYHVKNAMASCLVLELINGGVSPISVFTQPDIQVYILIFSLEFLDFSSNCVSQGLLCEDSKTSLEIITQTITRL